MMDPLKSHWPMMDLRTFLILSPCSLMKFMPCLFQQQRSIFLRYSRAMFGGISHRQEHPSFASMTKEMFDSFQSSHHWDPEALFGVSIPEPEEPKQKKVHFPEPARSVTSSLIVDREDSSFVPSHYLGDGEVFSF